MRKSGKKRIQENTKIEITIRKAGKQELYFRTIYLNTCPERLPRTHEEYYDRSLASKISGSGRLLVSTGKSKG